MKAKADSVIDIPVDDIILKGTLVNPAGASSLVILISGGSSNLIAHLNNIVAGALNNEKMATLRIGLLTSEEDNVYEKRFSNTLLRERLVKVTEWINQLPGFRNFNIGYFGAYTGAVASLVAAAKLKDKISAVVACDGRPDLAGPNLPEITAPTLLIEGGLHAPFLKFKEQAFTTMRCEKNMIVMPDSTNFFDESGKQEEVSKLACNWFQDHLVKRSKKHIESGSFH